jgi:hypothetical protein
MNGYTIPLTRELVEDFGEFIGRGPFGWDTMSPGQRAAMFLAVGAPRDTGGSWQHNPADLTENIGLTRSHYNGQFPECEDSDHVHVCKTCGLWLANND